MSLKPETFITLHYQVLVHLRILFTFYKGKTRVTRTFQDSNIFGKVLGLIFIECFTGNK